MSDDEKQIVFHGAKRNRWQGIGWSCVVGVVFFGGAFPMAAHDAFGFAPVTVMFCAAAWLFLNLLAPYQIHLDFARRVVHYSFGYGSFQKRHVLEFHNFAEVTMCQGFRSKLWIISLKFQKNKAQLTPFCIPPYMTLAKTADFYEAIAFARSLGERLGLPVFCDDDAVQPDVRVQVIRRDRRQR